MFKLHCKKHLQSILQISVCFSTVSKLVNSEHTPHNLLGWHQADEGRQWTVPGQQKLSGSKHYSRTHDPLMKGAGLPLHTWLKTKGMPELIHKQVNAPALEVAKVIRKGNTQLDRQPVCNGQGSQVSL